MEQSDMYLANCQINNFKIIKQIGSGSNGLVFHVTDIFSNSNFAMKIILKSHLFNNNSSSSSNSNKNNNNDLLLNQLVHDLSHNDYKLSLPTVDLDSVLNISNYQLETNPHYKELNLHLKVHTHQNVVTIHQIIESNFATFILMDYYPTDLFTSIVDHKHFSHNGNRVKNVFLQLLSVLEYCSSNDVYHCDLKPENILIDKLDNIYLCDFGLAISSSSSSLSNLNLNVGSSYYMAPERISPNKPTFNELTIKGDVWSLGIILINLTCIRNPWAKASTLEDKTFAYFINNPSVLQKILPISNDFHSLLLKILTLNPSQRISYDQIKSEIINIQSFTTDGPLSKVDTYLPHSNSTATILNSALPSTTTLTTLTTTNKLNANANANSKLSPLYFDDIIDLDYSRTTTPLNSDSFFKNYQTTSKSNNNNNNNNTTDHDNSTIQYDNELKDTLLSYQPNSINYQSSNDFLQF
ncbi:serine/threonine-protein kinase Vhs1p [Monosporozyma servazzii]